MKEYIFKELGYFSEEECNAIKEELQGYSYMNFDITWSNCAGSCILILRTDHKGGEKEIKDFFLHCALARILELKRSAGKTYLRNAKFVVNVKINEKNNRITTVSVFDNKVQTYMTKQFIKNRNIAEFLDVVDLKETLNWNLNGDSQKFVLTWNPSNLLEGTAYVFD